MQMPDYIEHNGSRWTDRGDCITCLANAVSNKLHISFTSNKMKSYKHAKCAVNHNGNW